MKARIENDILRFIAEEDSKTLGKFVKKLEKKQITKFSTLWGIDGCLEATFILRDLPSKNRQRIFRQIVAERERQDEKFGPNREQSPPEWLMILGEEVGEVNKAALEHHFCNLPLKNYREELIQVAAVAIAAIESLDMQEK